MEMEETNKMSECCRIVIGTVTLSEQQGSSCKRKRGAPVDTSFRGTHQVLLVDIFKICNMASVWILCISRCECQMGREGTLVKQ